MYPRISLNGVYARGGPVADDLALCAAVGIDWLAVPNWKFAADGPDEVIAAVEASEVGVSTVCHPNLFTLDDRSRWPAELAAAKVTIDQASAVGARSVYLTTGRRGSLNWPRAADAFVDAVAELVEYSAAKSMPLSLEPTAAFLSDLSILHTLGDTVDLCRRTGLQVNIDVFPAWADSTFTSAMPEAAALCGLVQISDYVDGDRNARERAVPGDGAVEWEGLFSALRDTNYRGLFDLELVGPRITQEGEEAAFRRAATWLVTQLRAYGILDAE
jgi:sugar phosphate isomerase/epimerase